ncbi:MAG: hypothetical protein OXH76_21060 [Boseongicola sp.]|nr:hypothetical protein [Boseongicola sp.]
MPWDETDIRAALEELPPLPADVSDWDVQTGTDSADEPAVWIWAVLRDENADFDALIAIRDLVLARVRDNSENPLGVYVSFRTVDEAKEVE